MKLSGTESELWSGHKSLTDGWTTRHNATRLRRGYKSTADDILIVYFYLSKKIRLDFSSEAEEISSPISSEKKKKKQ